MSRPWDTVLSGSIPGHAIIVWWGLKLSQNARDSRLACLERIALRKGWISPARMREIAMPMIKDQYGQYLTRMADE